MKTLKQFTKWFTKTGKDVKKTSRRSDIDITDFKKQIRKRQDEERERLEKWRTEMKKRNKNNIYSSKNTYSTSVGHLPGSTITSNSITTLADAKIRIDGSENGSMQVDVPLVVNGRDVMKELDEMRDSLLLLKRDIDMEAKYPRLRELKDEYEAALEKYKTFEAIKESK